MICKERDEKRADTKNALEKAGAAAERQLAHYLRRAFADDPEVLVLNDLRLEVEDETREVLQIDHLIIHRHGLIIVESKSVSGNIRVNRLGEWSRIWRGREDGMASPAKQAQRQAELLKKVLCDNSDELLGKILGLQKGFGNCPVEIFVAVSDKCVAKREIEVPELCKADQIPDRVREI